MHSLHSDGSDLIITLTGKFTHTDYREFLAFSGELNFSGKTRLVFDLAELDFIDSGGIGMLVMAADLCQKYNAEVVLRGAHGHVRTVIDNSHLSEVFTIC
ncbi:MAG TPA: STAS domain-containing protein [Candidatus Sulfotelmatobacter sp.]|jgi:anti-anti-sigma factor|nr:STAS domain-containing protein [Candidatus Sulfotelmatobacter sp.]